MHAMPALGDFRARVWTLGAGGLLALACLTAAWGRPAPAEASDPGPPAGSGDYLCTGRMALRTAARCSNLGPSAALAAEVRRGAIDTPLPTLSLDRNLGYLPFSYVRLSSDHPTPTYNSEDDARDGKHASGQIEPGFDFVSYTDCTIKNGKAVFLLSSGVFMRGGGDCGQVATSSFHGLAFYRSPERAFGWVLGGVYTAPAPGETQTHTQDWVNRYQVVQIYDSVDAGGTTWYEVAPDEWLEARLVAKVVPDPVPPGKVDSDRWISINLFEQTLTAYDHGQLVFATLVSSGLPGWWTRPGDFQIGTRLEKTVMSGAFAADRSDYYYLQDVPWTMYFDEARALHGAYWHNGFGYPRSHGCVNLSPADSHWLYDWADEGTWVHVWDPSGKTPTNDAAYGAGGA